MPQDERDMVVGPCGLYPKDLTLVMTLPTVRENGVSIPRVNTVLNNGLTVLTRYRICVELVLSMNTVLAADRVNTVLARIWSCWHRVSTAT